MLIVFLQFNGLIKNTKFNIKDIINYLESLGIGVAVDLNLKYNFFALY